VAADFFDTTGYGALDTWPRPVLPPDDGSNDTVPSPTPPTTTS
jgi:hypothetical protein